MAELVEQLEQQLEIRQKQDIELAKEMALDFVNILSVTPVYSPDRQLDGWSILFEYQFTAPPTTRGKFSYPEGVGGWRKYAVEWPGIPGPYDGSLRAGIEYCYNLAKALRMQLEKGA